MSNYFVKIPLFVFGIFLVSLVLSSCASSPDVLRFSMPSSSALLKQQVWPKPPQTPRYLYLGDLRGESNVNFGAGNNRSLMTRFFSALVGVDNSPASKINLFRPQQGVVADNGQIYIVDAGRRAVFVFDEKKSEFSVWNEEHSGLPLLSPVGIAIAEQRVLVTDSEQAAIFVLNDKGLLVQSIRNPALLRPTGIAYDAITKRIYVSDTKNNDIKVFTLQGELLNTFGQTGAGPGEFNRPTFLSFYDDKLYVADSLNARIQVFTGEGEFISSIGERGLYIGNFSRPKGIAVDSHGNIYVTESFYDYVLIFNSAGKFLLSIGGSGQTAGKFSQPTAVWIDSNDRVFISDMLNARVSMFQYLGNK